MASTLCPDLVQLTQLLTEQLPADEVTAIERHLNACWGCRLTVDLLVANCGLGGPTTPESDDRGGSILSPDTPTGSAGSGFPNVSGYEILGELGRGGMGVVYKARQTGLHRRVALKMIQAGDHADPENRARFAREGEAVARLHHPHIVQIYETGEQDGVPFYSMELVEGGTLSEYLGGQPVSPRDAADLLLTLADAVRHAHEHGIVHRDLKPANILFQHTGENTVRLKIGDFGLAKLLTEDGAPTAGLTRPETLMGTPSYAAPEQLDSRGAAVGPSADIYALGSLLYEMLTGRAPFQGGPVLQTMFHVLYREPVPPRQIRSEVPLDIETICLKCLQKEPDRRYDSALELVEDLRRFQEGRPIRARPVGWMEQGWRCCRRNPALACTTSLAAALWLALVAAVAFGMYSCWKARELEKAHGAERTQRQRAEGRLRLAEQGLLPLGRALKAAPTDNEALHQSCSFLSESCQGGGHPAGRLRPLSGLLGQQVHHQIGQGSGDLRHQ
jgi:hypothetical protein